MQNMVQLLKTPHMQIVVGALLALQIAAIIWPEAKAKLDEIRKLVYTYAIVFAAASTPPQPPKPEGQP